MDREQHQAVRRHLIERPEHQRAQGQNQVGRHVPLFPAIRVADSEINQRERDRGADSFDQQFGAAGSLEHKPHDGNQAEENCNAAERAHLELFRGRVEQRRIAIGQRLPIEQGDDDGDEIA